MKVSQKWNVIWTAWLLFLLISFGILEGIAIATDGITLSTYTWRLTQAWPLLPCVYGLVVGGLAVHFFWIFNPKKAEEKDERSWSD